MSNHDLELAAERCFKEQLQGALKEGGGSLQRDGSVQTLVDEILRRTRSLVPVYANLPEHQTPPELEGCRPDVYVEWPGFALAAEIAPRSSEESGKVQQQRESLEKWKNAAPGRHVLIYLL
jgi:hypothetical protein